MALVEIINMTARLRKPKLLLVLPAEVLADRDKKGQLCHYRRDGVPKLRADSQLLCDVTAKNSATPCSTFSDPHFGQTIFSLSCSLMVRITSNAVWHLLHTYS